MARKRMSKLSTLSRICARAFRYAGGGMMVVMPGRPYEGPLEKAAVSLLQDCLTQRVETGHKISAFPIENKRFANSHHQPDCV